MLRLSKTFRFLIPVSAAFLVVPGMSTVAQAQQGSDEIEEIITNWVNEYGLKNLNTNFVLAASDATIMLTEAPEVDDTELKQAMSWKLKDNSDIDVNNSVIDCFSIPGQRYILFPTLQS